MRYAKFALPPEATGADVPAGKAKKQQRREVLVAGHLFTDGICTVTDADNPLAPDNAVVVLRHHRCRLVERNF